MSYEAALQERYASIRSRLAPPPPRKPIVIPPPALPGQPYENHEQRRRRVRAQDRVAAEARAKAKQPPIETPLVVIGEPLDMLSRPSWVFILHYVAKKYHLAPRDITGKLRFTKIVKARQEAIWLVHHHCLRAGKKLSLSEIGRRFHRDHSTVLHAIRTVEKLRGQQRSGVSPAFNTKTAEIQQTAA